MRERERERERERNKQTLQRGHLTEEDGGVVWWCFPETTLIQRKMQLKQN